MTSERTEANWLQFKGKVKEQWGKLTDDDLDVIQGKRDQLIGKIKERHAIEHEEAERQVEHWHRSNPTFFFEKS
ncbi:CsbD family protein [Xylophilus rhododendri]|uniref:CsbD family protein n=1 Tax=Xylophilus rhododendri TaxID=2697032 RepID=A0A857J2P3_9BURK|nr:CsbD family protein [Xylophilus rhododendri]QHI97332.1 CsbD family protein [Xylophilus rhododendri]